MNLATNYLKYDVSLKPVYKWNFPKTKSVYAASITLSFIHVSSQSSTPMHIGVQSLSEDTDFCIVNVLASK